MQPRKPLYRTTTLTVGQILKRILCIKNQNEGDEFCH